MKKFRLSKLQLTSDTANRSGLQTVNMTSSTPDTVTGTTFKNVLVDETGEFVVSSTPAGAITEVYRGNTAPATPSTGRLWVDTSGSGEVLKQWNGTARSELDHLSVSTIAADATIGDSPTLLIVDGNSGLPINITLPAPNTAKGRRIEIYKYRGTSAITLTTPSGTMVNQYGTGALTYNFKNTSQNYFMSVRSDGSNWIVDDDNIYNRVANTLYVDLVYGNNTYAVREFESRPFATVAAAVSASQAGDTIVLRPGTYNIGAITLLHSLNVHAENGTIFQSGSWFVNNGYELNFSGNGIYNGTAATNEFFTIGTGTIRFEFEKITTAGKRFIRNMSGLSTLSPKVYGRVKEIDNSAIATLREVFCNFNAGLGAGLTELIDPVFDLEVGTVRGLGLFNITNKATNPVVNITFTSASYVGGIAGSRMLQLDSTGGSGANTIVNPKIHVLGYRIDGPQDLTTNLAMFYLNGSINGSTSGGYIDLDVKYFYSAGQFFVDNNGKENETYIHGDYHLCSNRSLYIAYQANGTGLTFSKPTVIHNHVKKCEVTGTPAAGWASISTPGVVFIVGQGAGYITDSLEHISSQYLVGGVDNQAVVGVNNNYTDTYVKFYGTKLYANNTLAGSTGLIHNDEGVGANNHGNIIYEFHNGVQFELLGNATQLISGGNANTNTEVKFYDDYATNIAFGYGPSINKVSQLNNYTTLIGASGTYTVADSDKDLYYDLTLGSLTLVLPDPAKFVNRELSIKVTATHASNLLTIDPVGAALIDGSATYIVPNTSTIRTNVVIKSDGTGRWIK